MELIESPARATEVVDLVPVQLPTSQRAARAYIGCLAAGSRPTQASALRTIAQLLAGEGADPDTLPWGQVGYQHAQLLRQTLAERYGPRTANRHLSAFRGVLREAWLLGQMAAEDYQRICAAIRNVKGDRLLAGRALDRGEVKALAHGCVADRNQAAGLRDVALIGLLYSSGLRRAEAVALEVADYDPETGAVAVLSGKGTHQRIAYISDGALDAVNDWLLVRGREPGPLFCPVLKSGVIVQRRMSAAAVRLILRKRVRLAALRPATPHDMRRTFISDMLDAGADLSTAQKLAGHANPATTAAYDRRGEEAKRKAAGLLHFPYERSRG